MARCDTGAATEFAMMITRRELLDTSIAQLQALAAFLSDQLSEIVADGSSGLEANACKDILHAVSRLIQSQRAVGVGCASPTRAPQDPDM